MGDERESPEIALILRCGASDETRSTGEIRRLARAVTDWSRVFALASRHVVVPLLARALSLREGELVSDALSARLRAAAQEGALNSLYLTGALVEVVRAFSAAGIDAMPFKGPTLAARVYGNLSLRLYQDLDVLVRRADVARARTVLASLGYAPVIAYNEHQRASLMLTGHHEQFARGSGWFFFMPSGSVAPPKLRVPAS